MDRGIRSFGILLKWSKRSRNSTDAGKRTNNDDCERKISADEHDCRVRTTDGDEHSLTAAAATVGALR